MRINIAILRYYNYTNLISSLSDLNREYLEDGMHMDLAQKKIFAEKQGKISIYWILRFNSHGHDKQLGTALPRGPKNLVALPEFGKLVTRDEQPLHTLLCDYAHANHTTRGAITRHRQGQGCIKGRVLG